MKISEYAKGTAEPSTPLPYVRAAVPDDYARVMEMCHQLYDENGAVNVHWPAVEECIMQGVNGIGAVLGVIGRPIEAMIYLRISRMWYSTDTILEELFNYVDPAHRKKPNLRALIQFAKNCSDRQNVPLLIGVISNHRTEAKVRAYSQLLGKPQGAFFLHNARKG